MRLMAGRGPRHATTPMDRSTPSEPRVHRRRNQTEACRNSFASSDPKGITAQESARSLISDGRYTTLKAVFRFFRRVAPQFIWLKAVDVWDRVVASRFQTTRAQEKAVAKGLALYNRCIYLVARKIDDIDDEGKTWNISSHDENKSLSFIRRFGERLNVFRGSCLARIYPPASNMDSHNFSPMPHWIHGAQLVALNYQHRDSAMLLNHGMFHYRNRGAGYVMKSPKVLGQDDGADSYKLALQIRILSAHLLPMRTCAKDMDASKPMNPVVCVSIDGVPDDVHKFETSVVWRNGFDPLWDEETSFSITRSDVAILCFEVFDVTAVRQSSGDKRRLEHKHHLLVAAGAFPVSGLRDGVRWVPLRDAALCSTEDCGMLVEVRCTEGQTSPPVIVSHVDVAASLKRRHLRNLGSFLDG